MASRLSTRQRAAMRYAASRRLGRSVDEVRDGAPSLVGRRMLRVEDGPLLRGKGRFVDDIQLLGLLHAAFFRSPFAHARLTRLDLGKARRLPGVRAVFAYQDL